MKHLIMGTAGHVDHGKTALVKALTKIDCDTHKEEKQRGITIHLGFAHLDLGNGETLGIVDVPGHRSFIHTMMAGASGIDFMLLVVAADSGIMPQTREHLNIMRILGIKHGLVVLTKVDIADTEMRKLARDDIEELTRGTFLESAPIVEISSKTGEGLEDLREAIKTITRKIESRPTGGVFRMFIDRIFSVSGFGTVVNGSVISGKVRNGDTLYILPGKGDGYRVRRLERHGGEVSEVIAGDRASINLVGLEKSQFRRGMLVSDRVLRETTLLDARLEAYEQGLTLGLWSQVIFHVGTYEQQARMHLLDRDVIKAGETALVQIYLQEPCVLQHGDRFVIRNSSDEWTLGGGEVIDISPLHHRRRNERILQEVSKLTGGKLSEAIAMEVRKFRRATTAEEVASSLNLASAKVVENVARHLPDDIIRQEGKGGAILLYTRQGLEDMRKGILKAVDNFRRDNPLAVNGAKFDDIRWSLRIDRETPGEEMLRTMLQKLTDEGNLTEKERSWRSANDLGDIDDVLSAHIAAIEDYICTCGMRVPLMSVMKEIAEKRRMSEKVLKQVLLHLLNIGAVYRQEGEVIHRTIVDACREKLMAYLSKNTEGITVAGFRDLTGSNRKLSLLLLAIFDSEKLTRRNGDVRLLAEI